MDIYLVRHGLSQANNRDNIGTPAFGSRDAELMPEGIEQARVIRTTLLSRFAIKAHDEPVATSTLHRTQQTAREAGFLLQQPYEQLDEIEPEEIGLERAEIRTMIDSRCLNDATLEVAANTLQHPPKERLWFTHGLLIAGICKVLDQHQDREDGRIVPRFGDAWKIEL